MSESAIYVIENCSQKIAITNTTKFDNYLVLKETKSLESFIKKTEAVTTKASNETYKPNKKYTKKNIESSSDIFTPYDTKINQIYDMIYNIHLSDIKAFFDSMVKNMIMSINNLVANTIAKFTGLVESVINTLKSIAANFISSITNTLTTMYNNAIASFTNALNGLMSKVKNILNSIKNAFSTVSNKITDAKKTANNFYERAKGQSSLSKLTQVNVKSVTGALKVNTDVLKDTPAAKILAPKLKIDTNKVLTFAPDPIAKLLGFSSSLIPKVSTKKIEEPKPTDDKAEYGKVQVKENKAGFQEVSDETPGNVRKVSMHPSGTYNSMLDNGDAVTKVTGDTIVMNDGNWNIKTSKDKVEIVDGDNKIEIRKGLIHNVTGDVNNNTDGDNSNVVKGDFTNDFKSDYTGKIEGDFSENIGGDKTLKVGGDLKEQIDGDSKTTVTGALNITVSGNISITSSGNINITSNGKTNITSKGNTDITSKGIINLKSAVMVALSAPMIKLG